MPDSVIRARITPELKEQATEVLARMGLSPSEAIRLFLHQVVNEKGLPFRIKVPNIQTKAAMREVEERSPSVKKYTDLSTMWQEVDEDESR
jgi:DNA-damage-inducible protein J